jgi:hypothetical protein
VLIKNFGGTKSLRNILGELKTKFKIFIGSKNIFIPLIYFNSLEIKLKRDESLFIIKLMKKHPNGSTINK